VRAAHGRAPAGRRLGLEPRPRPEGGAIETLIDFALLLFLGVVALAAVVLRNLLAVVMLFGVYSLLSAALFTSLDAVDVAMTEASVGVGISTVLMLATLALTTPEVKKLPRRPLLPLLIVVLTGATLIYGTLDMPRFGDPQAPIHQHVAPHYLAKSVEETTIPNVVTSVLASYRGFDTLGETCVVFTAGLTVLVLLGVGRGARRRGPEVRTE
jgi:multicomponent Na+:H+ antiporter subunit B